MDKEAYEQQIIVLTNNQISEHALSLPSLKYADKTIPHALEERLISPIESLHFAHSPKPIFDGQYLVKVIELKVLKELLAALKEKGLTPTFLSSGNTNEPHFCNIGQEHAYFNETDCLGTLPKSLFSQTLKAHQDSEVRCFSDSNPRLLEILEQHKKSKKAHFKIPYLEYFCISFKEDRNLNLLQGPFEPKKDRMAQEKWTKLALFSVIASFSLCLITFFTQFSLLKYQDGQLDKSIAKIYFQLFPEAKAIVSPKFRIQQLMRERLGASGGQQGFLSLLEKAAPALYKNDDARVINLKYQNQIMLVSLKLNSFAKLNGLVNQLKAEGIKVEQKNANTVGKQINALLEVQQ